jgi:hypothetical protein
LSRLELPLSDQALGLVREFALADQAPERAGALSLIDAFGGMVGGANKLMRRIGGRDMITWDAAVGGYRIDPRDADVVLATAADDGSRV